MDPLSVRAIGRGLVVAGLGLAAVGLVLWLGPRLPWIGRLPGDLVWRGRGITVYLPLATGLLLSIVLTIVLNLLLRR